MSLVAKFEDFSVTRQKVPLHLPINIEVNLGDIVVFYGDNGTGKTTLLRVLARLHRTWAGRYCNLARSVGYKPQDGRVFGSLTLRDVSSIATREQANELEQLLEFLELSDHVGQPLGLMSGGEGQRAALAIAMSRKPDLLLLDEPLAGIDSLSGNLIEQCIHQSSVGATVVVEHKQVFKVEATMLKRVKLERI